MNALTQSRFGHATVVGVLLALLTTMLVFVVGASPAAAADEYVMPVNAGGHSSGSPTWDSPSHPGARESQDTGQKAAGGDGTTRLRSGDGWYDVRIVATTSSVAPCGFRTIDTGGRGVIRQGPIAKTYTATYRYYDDGRREKVGGSGGSLGFGNGTYTCHYPPAYRDVRVTCVVSLTLNVSQTEPASRKRNVFSKTVNTAFAGNRTLANCLNSGGNISANIPLAEFGRYRGTGTANAVACWHRSYTSPDLNGVIPGDEILDCSAPYSVPQMVSYAQIDCTGAYPRWFGNPSFTMTECSNQRSNNPVYHCVVGSDVKVNGVATRNTELLRDGSVNTLQWNTPQLSGNRIRNFQFNGTTMQRSGTPWVKGKGASNNTFELGTAQSGSKASLLTSDAGSPRQSGVQTTWYGRWYAASDAGSPTALTPVFDFNAVVSTTTYTITAVNSSTGAWTITPTTRDVSTSGRCNGPTVNVSTLKVVNDIG